MKKLIRQCLQIAQRRNTPELHPEWGNFHHTSFITQGGKLIEWGTNRVGDSPIHGYPLAKIHSEVDVWMAAKGLLNHRRPWDLINIRLNRTGQLRNSQPCSCCQAFIVSMGCRKIYFSTDFGMAKQL